MDLPASVDSSETNLGICLNAFMYFCSAASTNEYDDLSMNLKYWDYELYAKMCNWTQMLPPPNLDSTLGRRDLEWRASTS